MSNDHNWEDTHWTNEQGETVEISEVLKLTSCMPVLELPIEDVVKIRTIFLLDPERVNNADVSYPILIVNSPERRYILDGNHRLQKSINQNRTTIKAKIIGEIL